MNEQFKSGGWMKGAVNPKHRGYCTPMTKKTCTPRRKAFARRAKKGFQAGGLINMTGYLDGASTANNPYNIIPGGDITMEGVSIPILGTPYKNGKAGKPIVMKPGENYKFDADFVHEKKGNIYAKGGYSTKELYNFLFEEDEDEGESPVTAPSDEELLLGQQKLAEEQGQLEQDRAQFEDDIAYQQSVDAAMAGGDEWVSKRNPYKSTLGTATSDGSFASRIGISEGAKTGQPTSLTGSALGRGQMIKGTRHAMYKKLGIPSSQFAAAEERYKTDPQFEENVINAYRQDLDARIPSTVQGLEREYMIAKGWYTGNPFYPDNKVPHPEAGNRLTAGQYATKFIGIK